MKLGDMVMLIGTDGFMPPIGYIGTIISPFDGEDFEVLFPSYPCPVPPGEWYIAPSLLMVINDGDISNSMPQYVEEFE